MGIEFICSFTPGSIDGYCHRPGTDYLCTVTRSAKKKCVIIESISTIDTSKGAGVDASQCFNRSRVSAVGKLIISYSIGRQFTRNSQREKTTIQHCAIIGIVILELIIPGIIQSQWKYGWRWIISRAARSRTAAPALAAGRKIDYQENREQTKKRTERLFHNFIFIFYKIIFDTKLAGACCAGNN